MTRCAQMLRRSSVAGAHAWLLAVMCLLATGCARSQAPPLRIAAASDLQAVLPKLVERFQAKAGTTASVTIGASGQLAEQIKQGAPFDIFLSANETFVSELAAGGFIQPGSVHRYARGSLVLVVYHAFDDKIRSLDDLKRPEVKRIALANPEIAPYGKAGKQALQRVGLWDQLESKIVIAGSVRQALLYAQKGDVEAALVGRAIANVPEVRQIEVDDTLYDPIIQALGIVAVTKLTAQAEQFSRFVLDAEGQQVLKEYGFASGEDEQAKSNDHGAPRASK
jgi:molybdate transport system substrate-binding protein